MNNEILIKTITQEVMRQVELMNSQGAQTSVASGSKILLSDMRPNATVADIKKLYDTAERTGSYAVCIPQWFVAHAKEKFYGSKQKIATIVGLPGGTNSPFAKYAEIKQAVAAGADIILVPINMNMCNGGSVKNVQKDLSESLTASKGKAEAAAIIEVKDLSNSAIADVAKACVEAGANAVVLSAVTGGSISVDVVRDLKAKGICVGVVGGVTNRQDEYKRAGADWLIVK